MYQRNKSLKQMLGAKVGGKLGQLPCCLLQPDKNMLREPYDLNVMNRHKS